VFIYRCSVRPVGVAELSSHILPIWPNWAVWEDGFSLISYPVVPFNKPALTHLDPVRFWLPLLQGKLPEGRDCVCLILHHLQSAWPINVHDHEYVVMPG
jgi:hypothetical protein